MRKKIILSTFMVFLCAACTCPAGVLAAEPDAALFDEAYPYIKYFSDKALASSSDFPGLTPSFQLYIGGHTSVDEQVISYGASSYDQTILGRIALRDDVTTVLDTFTSYYQKLQDAQNPVVNTNGSYYDAAGNPIVNGPYRLVRILGRDVPSFWETWDWTVDTGSAACMIIYAVEAYERTLAGGYKNMAITLGEYVLLMQDSDGGIRYGPRGMYHDPDAKSDFYWRLKSTEQNERLFEALSRLYAVTGDVRFGEAAGAIRSWLIMMYDPEVHLFHAAASYDGAAWVATGFSYVTTDVTAFAPLQVMVDDPSFGSTTDARCNEIDAMFAASETRCAFYNSHSEPILFRFSISQTGDYGSVEMSSQMALAYFKALRIFMERGNTVLANKYRDRYETLVTSLAGFFAAPTDDPSAKIAPYASYLNGAVAGGLPTGTGYYTFNCLAALASSHFGLTKIEVNDYLRAESTQMVCLEPGADSIVAVTHLAEGVEESDGTAWDSISPATPDYILSADIDGCGRNELIVDFGPRYGVWARYGGANWQKIHDMSPTVMASGDIDGDGKDDIIMSFGKYGIWARTGNGLWVLIHTVPARGLTCGDINGDGTRELIADFGRMYGIWARSSDGAWQKIHGTSAASVTCADINGDGTDEIVVDFGSRYGIWVRQANSAWTKLHGTTARTIASGDIDGDGAEDLAIDFGDGVGIWIRYGTGAWLQAHSMGGYALLEADVDGDGRDELMVDFGIRYGVWARYYDGRWYNIKPGRA